MTSPYYIGTFISRSREGAWIEILYRAGCFSVEKSRSREGAWIEIVGYLCIFGRCKSRSREGAWIEIPI